MQNNNKNKLQHIKKCTEAYFKTKDRVAESNFRQQVELIRKNAELQKDWEDTLEPKEYEKLQNKKQREIKQTLKGYVAGKKHENKELADAYEQWDDLGKPKAYVPETNYKQRRAKEKKHKQYLKKLAKKNLALSGK